MRRPERCVDPVNGMELGGFPRMDAAQRLFLAVSQHGRINFSRSSRRRSEQSRSRVDRSDPGRFNDPMKPLRSNKPKQISNHR
jgi:hypothetical protein